jgi:uncharacterized membrane protein
MRTSLNEAAAAQAMGADAMRFKQWALMVGCVYGAVTLLVAILATVGVLAGRPLISSGYSSAPSLVFTMDN